MTPFTSSRLGLCAGAAILWAATSLTSGPDFHAVAQQPQAGKPANVYGPQIRDERRRFRTWAKSWTELKKVNVVMQQRDYSCGAAALATLLKYHWGDPVTETQVLQEIVRTLTTIEELRDRIENGFSLTDLRRASVRMGYLASIGRLEFDKLRESKVPVVVGIIVNEYDHFVVYRGTDDRYVYLADPARGNIRVPVPDFLKQWQQNAVLVVVKRGLDESDTERHTPLTLRVEEILFGELNRLYLRDQVTSGAPFIIPQ